MRIKNIIATKLRWLPIAAVIIILGGTTYAAIQQSYRLGANDPQIQIARDAATALGNGTAVEAVVPNTLKVDIAKSLSLTIGVYDENGKLVDSSTILDGQIVSPSAGVFDHARRSGENRFTWQPKEGVKQAAVLVHYTAPGNDKNGANKGFVLVSRSLTEIEQRIKSLGILVGAGTIATLLISLLLMFIVEFLERWVSKRKDKSAEEGPHIADNS